MAIGSRSPLLNIPCWLDGIPELRFVQHLAELVLTASQRSVHRELTERVTFVFVIVIVPLQITAGPALPLPSSCDGQPSVGPSMRIIWACLCPLFACCCSRFQSTHEDLHDKHMFTCVDNSAVLECEARHSCEC